MHSNGELYFKRGALNEWTIGYECFYHGIFRFWIPKLAPLVDEIKNGVDPDSLPPATSK
jgi:hypothetical protein